MSNAQDARPDTSYLPRLLLVLTTALAPVAAHAAPPDGGLTIANHGVGWFSGSVQGAAKVARAEDKPLLLKFEADWCGPCKRLAHDVFSGASGRSLLRGYVGKRVDFDDPANRALVEKHTVISLPSVVILSPRGQELGRIEGFESKQAFLTELEAIRTTPVDLKALRTAHDKRPDDAAAALAWGRALLYAGDHGAALPVLEKLAADDAGGTHAARALFVLGRFHQRVKRDPARAIGPWRRLAERFPDDDYAGGAWWWWARAGHELGCDASVVRRWKSLTADPKTGNVGPEHGELIGQWAGWARQYAVGTERTLLASRLVAAKRGVAAADKTARLQQAADAMRAPQAEHDGSKRPWSEARDAPTCKKMEALRP